MKKGYTGIWAAVLCLLLAGCGGTPVPSADLSMPASAVQTEAPAEREDAPEEAPGEEQVPQEIADAYVGEWQDTEDGPSGGQCRLSIVCGADGVYAIDIDWDNSHWSFTGTYDEIWEGIDYVGTRYLEQTAGRYS